MIFTIAVEHANLRAYGTVVTEDARILGWLAANLPIEGRGHHELGQLKSSTHPRK
jgi:hypothetical protein